MQSGALKTSLLITTYNWEDALDLVLRSVQRQTRMPDEVLVADDGSGQRTRDLIESWRDRMSCPLKHIWHDDDGFRASVIRNKTVAVARGDYVITVDGDMVLQPDFIRDHLSVVREGQFVQGRRVRLNQALTDRALEHKRLDFGLFTAGVLRRQQNIRSHALSRWSSHVDQSFSHVRGCNMAFWKRDFLSVNGYNEDMVGWGYEDWELCSRLYNRGLHRYYLRFKALAYHLEHGDVSRERKGLNQDIFEASRADKLTRSPNGVDKYLA